MNLMFMNFSNTSLTASELRNF